jgi:hypothetical protein
VSERSWTIRDYEAGDEQAICALFERVFHKSMGPVGSLDEWRWQFADNPVGPRVIKLAVVGNQVVGHYAVAPRQVWVDGQTHLAALSLVSMTDPDYGRQGIFSATAEACYARMVEHGFALVYGFPNANSIAGFERKLEWTMIATTPVLVKALDLGELAAAKLGIAAASRVLGPLSRAGSRIPGLVDELAHGVRARVRGGPELEVVRFDRFGPWVDALWQRCRDQHRLWAVRDQAFLRWRYDRRPDYDYYRLQVLADGEVVGYLVYTLSEREEGLTAFIMDVVTEPVPGAMEALLRSVEARARIQGARLLSAMAGPATRERRVLLRHAYLPLPESLFPKQLYFGGRTFDGLPTSTLADPARWQLGWGDVDVL